MWLNLPAYTWKNSVEYARIILNVSGQGRPPLSQVAHQYPWIFLNILENTWINCSDYARALKYAWSSYMFDMLLKMPWVLNMLGIWIWHGCICKGKGYPGFRICLIMAPYTSIMPEYYWISVNMPKNTWINCFDHARVLHMLDIVIITLLL